MKTFVKVLARCKKYWPHLIIAFIAMLGYTVVQLYTPKAVQSTMRLIEDGAPDAAKKIMSIAITLLALYFIGAVCQFLRAYLNHVAAHRFVCDTRTKLYGHLQKLSLRFYHDKQTGQLMSRIISDTLQLEVLIAHAAPEIVLDVVTVTGVAVILFYKNVPLALLSLALMPAIGAAVWYHAKKVRPLFREGHQKTAELSAALQDNFSGIKEIQVFNKQEHELERVSAIAGEFTDFQLRALRKSAIVHPLITFLNQLGTVLVIGVGGFLASRHGMPGSEIVAFILYLNVFYQPITAFGRLAEDLQNSLAAVERVMELFCETSDVTDAPDAAVMPKAAGELEFCHVNFSYNPGVPVLKDVSFHIAPGETVAIVGPTGVGKTTIASLITRFYDPDSGAVKLDGVDIKTITAASLRDNISIVLQDVFLFNGTIAQNIAYGAEGATMEQVEAAAKIANADGFIRDMDDGYETIIGERGIRLSGGQKQRISIARAILRARPILILDEATASVDNTTEKLIHQAVDRVIANQTTIVIAHRLSTIKNADKILVLENGRVAQCGTHEELLTMGGLYGELYNA